MTEQTPELPGLLLPEGTRLVHIGPPKTGTTALQGAFHTSRDEVIRQGVRYAGRSRHSAAAVLAVTERPSFSQDMGSPPIQKWEGLAREVRSARESRVLISSEFFADSLPEYIPRIINDLGGDAVHVVVTLRPLARILSSQWQQYVQSGLRMDFEPWLSAMFDPERSPFMATFWRRHRHDELIARWMDVVGPERITVVVLDEREHDRVLRVFEELLGLRTGTLSVDRDLANRSMTMPEIQAVRTFNNQFREAGLGNALLHKVMHFGAATHMKLREPQPGWQKIETPAWALDRAAALSSQMVANIRAMELRVVGNLDDLITTGGHPAHDAPAEVLVPPEVAGAMAMGVLMASGLVRRTGGVVESVPGQAYAEPPEVVRLSTRTLTGVVVRRTRAGVVRRVRRLIGRA